MYFKKAIKINNVKTTLRQETSVYNVVNSLNYEFLNDGKTVFSFKKISENPNDLTSLIMELINNNLILNKSEAIEKMKFNEMSFRKELIINNIEIHETDFGYSIECSNLIGKSFTSLLFEKEEIAKIMIDLL